MNQFAVPFAVMLVLVLADAWALRFVRKQRVPWRDVIFNQDSGHIVLWLFRGVEVAVFAWLSVHANLRWVDRWHPAAIWVFAFFAWDISFYWLHRLHHGIPLMWAVHVVHHEGEHFNLSLGVRNSWYSSLTSIPFFAWLAVIGLPVDVFVAISGFHYSVQFYNHCGTVGKSGWLDRFLVTPANHRVHHGSNPEYVDRNFGGTLLIWDKLFGTWQPELPGTPIRYGVHGSVPTQNPFWASTLPFFRCFGWRQPRIGAARGVASVRMPDGWIALGGVVLFCVVIYYVYRQGTWPPFRQSVLFLMIAALTVALGGMSDARGWGLPSWVALSVALPAAFIGVFALRDWLGAALFMLQAAHGLATPWLTRAAPASCIEGVQ